MSSKKETIEQIDNIREFYRKQKADNYPIINDGLSELDEYSKGLYMKMLCTIVQYSSNEVEMQVMYLSRIVKGSGYEEHIEDYMRRALDISQSDVNEFLSIMKESELRYIFCIDAMLLLGVTEKDEVEDRQYELVSEIIELLSVKKDELEYLTKVTIAILNQSSEDFNVSKENKPYSLEGLSVYSYIKDFYRGAIIDTADEKYYHANELEKFVIDEQTTSFETTKVTFENLILSVENDWNFMGCKEVLFKNCHLIGKEGTLMFGAVGKVEFEGCTINGFENRIAIFDSIIELKLSNNKVRECGNTTKKANDNGGCFLIKGQNCKMVEMTNNQFQNSYIVRNDKWLDWGERDYETDNFAIIMSAVLDEEGEVKLKDNKFIGNYYKEIRTGSQGDDAPKECFSEDNCLFSFGSSAVAEIDNNECSGIQRIL